MAYDSLEFDEFKKKHPSASPVIRLTLPDNTFIMMPPEAWEGIKESAKKVGPEHQPELIKKVRDQFPLMTQARLIYVVNMLQIQGIGGKL